MPEATLTKSQTQYLDDLAQQGESGQPAWLDEIRADGKSVLESTTFPHNKMEEWRHTNISALTKTHYKTASETTVSAGALSDATLAPAGWAELVFVDGHYSATLSNVTNLPEGVILGNIPAHQGSEVLQQHIHKILQHRNAYTALNSAFLQDGAFVYVPKKVVVETPIHLLFVSTTGAAGCVAHVRTIIALEESSAATITTSYVGLDDTADYLNNVVEEIYVGANAQLTYYKVVQEGAAGNHLATSEILQDRDSRLFSLVISQDGKVIRNQSCVKLAGEGAECALHGLYLNDGDRLIDNALHIHHTVPHCNSRIAYKGILDGKSKTVFTGKVNVDQAAQQTDSDQLSNNLLLSDTATLDTKPQLEIYADDVKCTHGATVGSHPEPIIFYFQSRGIDEATARGMLTYGFADEIVREIKPEALRDRLESYVFRKYSPKQ
ncbi:MAG: Fe-S cluster assembly protein SufD [Candidatus Hydrogenedentes bacterium]|nr:Fe-S cluster assembly protein SufD [Candidatus Hydrogenedentota bacterium]